MYTKLKYIYILMRVMKHKDVKDKNIIQYQ